MSGERDLDRLLAGMGPELDSAVWVVVTTASSTRFADGVTPFATVDEDEGLTVVLREEQAERLGVTGAFRAARITLRVHSDLEAVGLTAAVSSALAGAGISCNVIAGYYHDHLLVPYERGEEALRVLTQLAASRAEATS